MSCPVQYNGQLHNCVLHTCMYVCVYSHVLQNILSKNGLNEFASSVFNSDQNVEEIQNGVGKETSKVGFEIQARDNSSEDDKIDN